MRHRTTHAFTLIEILTVIVIILIIAGWIVSAFSNANITAAKRRAEGEIQAMSTACDAYKAEFGSYPRSDVFTEGAGSGSAPIDPRKHGNPATDAYRQSSLFLYKALSGDADANYRLEPPDEPTKGYYTFEPRMLEGSKDKDGRISKVSFIKDPFGNSYGYSTAGAKAEDDFRADAERLGAKAKRPGTPIGFNPTFDLWSTAGKSVGAAPTDADRNRWVKNW